MAHLAPFKEGANFSSLNIDTYSLPILVFR